MTLILDCLQKNADDLCLQGARCNREDYAHLPYSKEDDRIVDNILQKTSVFSLHPWKILRETSELIVLGNQMAQLHPLRFLEGCVATPSRVGYIQKILKIKFVGCLFLGKLVKRFSAYQQERNLEQYWPGFWEKIGPKVSMDQREISIWSDKRDWKDFLQTFFSHI